MINTLNEAVKKKGAGEAVLYAGLIGLVLSDIIPTPADAVYFRLMARNKKLLSKGEISPKQYWTRDAVLYYGLNPIWWSLVLLAVWKTKGDVQNKVKTVTILLGAGAVIGVLAKNIEEERK